MYRPYHLIGLELGISVVSAALCGEANGSSDSLVADVASVAKKDVKPGDILDGEGGYTVYGWLVRAEESVKGKYFPMDLSSKAKVVRLVAKDSVLTYDDVKVNDRLFSYKIHQMIEEEFKSLG